jgi:hypothetical protein
MTEPHEHDPHEHRIWSFRSIDEAAAAAERTANADIAEQRRGRS